MSYVNNPRDLARKPKDQIRTIYNSLSGVVPGVVPVNDNDRVSKEELMERLINLKNIRPRHISAVHNKSPFAVRDYLRRAARREGLDHLVHKPWKLSGLEYVILCGKIINAELRAKANEGGAQEPKEPEEFVAEGNVSNENSVEPSATEVAQEDMTAA